MANLMRVVKIGDKFGVFYDHQIDFDLKPTGQEIRISGITYPVFEPVNTSFTETSQQLFDKMAVYQLKDYLVEN